MISRILIALDGSAHAMKAVDIGTQIAAALKAKVALLHVVRLEKVPEAMRQFVKTEQLPGTDVDVIMRGAEHMLAEAADKIRAAGIGDVDIEVVKGPVARTIVATAKRHDADMIVLGSRGMGDIEGLLRGGVSHRVEILAKCPVLVVK